MVRNKVTDVATMVMDEGQRPSSGDRLIAVFASQEKYNTHVT
jgi:hypothetical protein